MMRNTTVEKAITLKDVLEICAALNYVQTIEFMLKKIKLRARLRKKACEEGFFSEAIRLAREEKNKNIVRILISAEKALLKGE